MGSAAQNGSAQIVSGTYSLISQAKPKASLKAPKAGAAMTQPRAPKARQRGAASVAPDQAMHRTMIASRSEEPSLSADKTRHPACQATHRGQTVIKATAAALPKVVAIKYSRCRPCASANPPMSVGDMVPIARYSAPIAPIVEAGWPPCASHRKVYGAHAPSATNRKKKDTQAHTITHRRASAPEATEGSGTVVEEEHIFSGPTADVRSTVDAPTVRTYALGTVFMKEHLKRISVSPWIGGGDAALLVAGYLSRGFVRTVRPGEAGAAAIAVLKVRTGELSAEVLIQAS